MQQGSYYKMEDIALWNLMLKGDMMSLEVLYRRHYELLLNYGLKYCTDEEMVKDAIQDLSSNYAIVAVYHPQI